MTKFTNVGYINDDDTMALLRPGRSDDGTIRYMVENKPVDTVTIVANLDKKSVVECERWHLDQALDVVYNTIRGQRRTVQQYTNAFVDRYPKTFFSDAYRFSIEPKQYAVMMATAIGNYYNQKRWSVGVVEDIYDAYCLIKGSYAMALLEALDLGWLDSEKRGEAVPGDVPEDQRAYSRLSYYPSDRFVTVEPGDERVVEAVRKVVVDYDTAGALLEGVFMCAYILDHTANGKPMKTAKEQKHYRLALELMKGFDPDDYTAFYSVDLLEGLIGIGRNVDTIMVIPAGHDATIDVLEETVDAWRTRTGISRPFIEHDTVPVKVSYSDEYKMSDDDRRTAAPKKRGRRRKSSAVEEEINKLTEIDELHVEDISPHML